MIALVGILAGATPPVTTLDTVALATLLSLFFPLVVAFITKLTASDGLKAVVNFVGSGVLAVVAIWMVPNQAPVTWQLCLNTFIAALITSFATYKGFWKPTGISGTVATKSARFGLGPKPVLQTADKGAEDIVVQAGEDVRE